MLFTVLNQVQNLNHFLQVSYPLLLSVEREVPKLGAFAPFQTNVSPELTRVASHLDMFVEAGSDESRRLWDVGYAIDPFGVALSLLQ